MVYFKKYHIKVVNHLDEKKDRIKFMLIVGLTIALFSFNFWLSWFMNNKLSEVNQFHPSPTLALLIEALTTILGNGYVTVLFGPISSIGWALINGIFICFEDGKYKTWTLWIVITSSFINIIISLIPYLNYYDLIMKATKQLFNFTL